MTPAALSALAALLCGSAAGAADAPAPKKPLYKVVMVDGDRSPLPVMRRGVVVLIDAAAAKAFKEGDHVDVLAEPADLAPYGVVKAAGEKAGRLKDGKIVLVPQARVMAVRAPTPDSKGAAAVKLSVSPDEAQFVALSRARGVKLILSPAPEK